MLQKTPSTKSVSAKDVARGWHLVDMKGKTLGRSVNMVAKFLQGKHKVTYVPYIDSGDNVVVINAKYLVLSGKKIDAKVYNYYSGYPGGLRTIPAKALLDKKPQELVRHAVAGMLPKNKLRDKRLQRLYIFAEEKHPYADKIKKLS